MPTPSSNVGLSHVQTEFTGSNPISLSEYYRGGGTGYVPTGTAAGTSGVQIATSGAINLGDFRNVTRNVGAAVNPIPIHSLGDYSEDFSSAGISFMTDGNFVAYGTLNNIEPPYIWYNPLTANIGSSFWIRSTLVSGSALVYSPGAGWYQLNVIREFINDSMGNSSRRSTIKLDISTAASDATIVATRTFSITSQSYSGSIPL